MQTIEKISVGELRNMLLQMEFVELSSSQLPNQPNLFHLRNKSSKGISVSFEKDNFHVKRVKISKEGNEIFQGSVDIDRMKQLLMECISLGD